MMKTRAVLFLLVSFSATGWLMAQKIKMVPAEPTRVTDGKAMYTAYCAACHGQDGKGNGPAASALRSVPTDLTRLSTHNKGAFPAQSVGRYIKGLDAMAAHGSRDMPVWGPVFWSLNPNDTDLIEFRVIALTNYVKSLQAE